MTDEEFMRAAFEEAQLADAAGEYPVGAVVIQVGEIAGRGHNAQARLCDPTAHAEIVAIRAGCNQLKQRKLSGCLLYTTLEPCPMCDGAIVEADLEKVIFGGSLFAWIRDVKFGQPQAEVEGPVDEAGRALCEKRLREKGRDEVFEYELGVER